MTKRRSYGQTWWGAAWLKALRDVPNENRLGRGRSYYQSGRVFNVEFDKSTLTLSALVDGSAYTPYEVQFCFAPIEAESRSKLIAAIASDPSLAAQIIDGELPPQLLDICKSLKINLFPSSWRQLHPVCSCPDFSPFCKHLAALFYLLLDLIDRDPFFVFLTRGIDLQEEMKKTGVDLCNIEQERPKLPLEFIKDAAKVLSEPKTFNEEEALKILRSIDFTGLPDMSETLASLLPEKFRPFTKANMRTQLRSLLRRAAREAKTCFFLSETYRPEEIRRALLVSAGFDDDSFDSHALIHPAVGLIDGAETACFTKIVYKKPRARKVSCDKRKETRCGALARSLLGAPALAVEEMPVQVECFQALAKAAVALLTAQALAPVPVIARHDADLCPRLWWTPMVREPRTARLIEELARGISPWAASLVDDSVELNAEDPRFVQHTVLFLLSAIINSFIADAAGNRVEPEPQNLLASCQSVSELDGRTPQDFTAAFTRYFRAFLLSDGYPWKPVLTARTHPDGVKINFGILGRENQIDSVPQEAAPPTNPNDQPTQRSANDELSYDRRKPVMLKTLLTSEEFSNQRLAVVNVLKTLAEACPILEHILHTEGRPVTLDAKQLKDFLFDAAPVLMVLGVTLMLPQSLKRVLRPRLVASVSAGKSTSNALLGKDALSRFEWKAALGGRELSEQEMQELVAHAGEVVRLGNDFVYLDPEALAKLARTLREQPQPSYLEKMRAAFTGEYDGSEVRLSGKVLERLQQLTTVANVAPPAGLRASLRPYQQRGYSWLMKNLRLGIGALIADDMGLGKTLQVIAAVTALKEAGELDQNKVLAVVPTTLLANWIREVAKFSPGLTTGLYHGPNRSLPSKEEAPDITLTTYGTLRRDAQLLTAYGWRLLILDEAQAIKNASSAQSMAVRSLGIAQTIAMTGTPVENRLMEYWSILGIVQPHLLGSARDFESTFATPIESAHDQHAAQAFRRLTAPFMLRRLKSDKSIIADLPERTSMDLFTTLTPEQAGLYQKTLEAAMRRIEKIETEAKQSEDASRNAARVARRGTVIKLITSLKQICNSPSQYLKTAAPRPDSGKGAALLDTLERCHETGRKVLIFTQYREMGERIQTWLKNAAGESTDFLHGGVPVSKRQEMVDRFQTDRSVRSLIVSLKAGGTGLNLTAASAVIHYDLWWNPAVEAQATDRAYRIGQRRDVIVYRFVTSGTFEERINDMLTSKKDLADMTVATGETWIGDLPKDELRKLFCLEQ